MRIFRVKISQLPDHIIIVWREKDAAQHASGVHDVMKDITEKEGYAGNKKYRLKTRIEDLGSVYRYGNKYRTDVEEYGDDNIQAYLEAIALDIGIAHQ